MAHSVYTWIKQGLIKPQNQQQAMELADERPSRSNWLVFSHQFLLLVGLLSLAFGLIFFFAYNWNELSRMTKFLLVQAVLLATFVLYFFKAKSFWLSQSLLLTAALLIGALLALFGQTYQTGADPWQLFATWAMLLLPLVLFSRSEVLWLVLASLLNLALLLYLKINPSIFGLMFDGGNEIWSFLILNVALLVLLEGLHGKHGQWAKMLQPTYRWAAQVLGVVALFVLSAIGMEGIWGDSDQRGANLLMFVLLMGCGFAFYRFVRQDLLLLTAWALAMMVFILSFLGHSTFRHLDASGFLLMAITLIGMSAWTVKWIKQLHVQFSQENQS
ncbi:DUF2157 domain-containing protein [Marinicella sp. S1101]|uniref:DUF2157 domain-containing protein n=1 Tax=Marinicella marina TaxID=2996016 RepID=UPI0022609BFD|nr:DUF2157 domain-containing protein [Marinicella marina]MCX7554934.1 DUF2157 domain-containing protein [Marinicella marina]MDJ1141544.1 DUF2157 domain-containing protein [Marinicella marina]